MDFRKIQDFYNSKIKCVFLHNSFANFVRFVYGRRYNVDSL